MSRPYLEITYREGKPFAAYLYLERKPGDTAARTERRGQWLVDFTADGRAIGIEFTQFGHVDLDALNAVVAAAKQPKLSAFDLAPLEAA